MTQEPQKSHAVLIVIAIIGIVGTIVASAIVAFSNYQIEKERQSFELTRIALASSNTQGGATQSVSQSSVNTITETPFPIDIPNPTLLPKVNTPISNSNDTRDIAAQALGYDNLDGLMSAFEIPTEIKSRVFVCPNEETWCIGVYEEPGQADFHFKNVTNCTLDGKQVNGASIIPASFDGMVKGFTLRPCSR